MLEKRQTNVSIVIMLPLLQLDSRIMQTFENTLWGNWNSCSQCSYTTFRADVLKVHMIKHTGFDDPQDLIFLDSIDFENLKWVFHDLHPNVVIQSNSRSVTLSDFHCVGISGSSRSALDHETSYISWNLWPTAFRSWFFQSVFTKKKSKVNPLKVPQNS